MLTEIVAILIAVRLAVGVTRSVIGLGHDIVRLFFRKTRFLPRLRAWFYDIPVMTMGYAPVLT